MTPNDDDKELPAWAQEMLRKQSPDATTPDEAETGDEHPVYLRNPRLREVVDLLLATPSTEFRDAMLDCGLVDEAQLLEALSLELGLERVDWSAATFDPEILALVPAEVAWRLVAFPVRIGEAGERKEEGGKKEKEKEKEKTAALCVALGDPFDRAAVEELERLVGRRVVVMLATPDEILRQLGTHYL